MSANEMLVRSEGGLRYENEGTPVAFHPFLCWKYGNRPLGGGPRARAHPFLRAARACTNPQKRRLAGSLRVFPVLRGGSQTGLVPITIAFFLRADSRQVLGSGKDTVGRFKAL